MQQRIDARTLGVPDLAAARRFLSTARGGPWPTPDEVVSCRSVTVCGPPSAGSTATSPTRPSVDPDGRVTVVPVA